MADEIFDALADRYRRRLLVELLDRNPTSVSSRSARHGERSSSGEATVRSRHVHLPKLEERGYISWNREQGIVMKGPRFDEIEPVLELLHGHRAELPENWV